MLTFSKHPSRLFEKCKSIKLNYTAVVFVTVDPKTTQPQTILKHFVYVIQDVVSILCVLVSRVRKESLRFKCP